MTAQLKICDENAEHIGRPIFDKIIRSFQNSDREELLQYFPYLHEWMTVEIFDEAVEVQNRLGKLLSSKYSSHSIENDNHVLVWKVNYENDENTVHWKLFLIDNQNEVLVNGFAFDR
ncbi:hypothetical protein [Granulosicoccus antarcticus]|uniref:SnoaL-like domain-containing protein n=1 Tax=Granulosicoccus antarcticus IMCC3135 TaxID=1192854 RepID=A0A2Z2NZJ0_9GAMM|nr:hypothetical protein [Granulosicoccus antarcticus]ASJ73227.1 hypothetical protein IMCC3135_15725 [Granulosicoccus antarcticus IMCC3135]